VKLSLRKKIGGKELTTDYSCSSWVSDVARWQVFATVTELVNFYQNNGVELLGDSRRNVPVGMVKLQPMW